METIDRKTTRKVLTNIILIAIPAIIIFLFGAYTAGKNADRTRIAIEKTLPAALAYLQLERNMIKMQKWLTHISATRAEPGYDNGFSEAEKYFTQIDKDFEKLMDIFKDDPKEQKKLSELYTSKDNYYEMGREVANSYIDGGTEYGNAMLDVFSIVDNQINSLLNKYTAQYTGELFSMNKSIEGALNNTRILFIVMGLLSIVLGYTGYKFLIKRAELSVTNIRLSEAMDAIWGEMQLAKKIQTVLLPEKPQVKGFEVTGHMITADDVGGDYYDIININGMDWLVIGDVSGHGVPAGLVMMMVQTSIQTVLYQHPDIPPAKLLTIINKIVANNIKKLGDDKYMTITVFALHEKGKFTFSGLHQDIIVYRKSSNSIELIETEGMWIGLIDNLDGMNKNDTFQLSSGDIILLYTDGITEAMDENENMFSQKKLTDMFWELSEGGSVEDIKNGLVNELNPYRLDDDVTIMVVKMD